MLIERHTTCRGYLRQMDTPFLVICLVRFSFREGMKYPRFVSFPHLVGTPISEARTRADATEATLLSDRHRRTPSWTREAPSRPCSCRTSTTSQRDGVTYTTGPTVAVVMTLHSPHPRRRGIKGSARTRVRDSLVADWPVNAPTDMDRPVKSYP